MGVAQRRPTCRRFIGLFLVGHLLGAFFRRTMAEIEPVFPEPPSIGITLVGFIPFRVGGTDSRGGLGLLLARRAKLLRDRFLRGALDLRSMSLRECLSGQAGRQRWKWADAHGSVSGE